MAGEIIGEQQGEKRDRDALKSAFLEGKKPTEQDFADVFESFLNLDEERVTVDEGNLEFAGSIIGKASLNVAGDITGQGNLTIDGSINDAKAKSLTVSGEITTASLKVGDKVVEQVWERTDEGASFDGDVSIGNASIAKDGSASFPEIKVDKLSIGDDEWEGLPKELWSETQPGSISYDGTVTIAGDDHELVVEGKASIKEIAADEIILGGKPLLIVPSEWNNEGDNLQHLGTVEVKELKLLGAIATTSISTLEQADSFLQNNSNIELKDHIASLHGILRKLIDEIRDLKNPPEIE